MFVIYKIKENDVFFNIFISKSNYFYEKVESKSAENRYFSHLTIKVFKIKIIKL